LPLELGVKLGDVVFPNLGIKSSILKKIINFLKSQFDTKILPQKTISNFTSFYGQNLKGNWCELINFIVFFQGV
jgi:hypothetical protein